MKMQMTWVLAALMILVGCGGGGESASSQEQVGQETGDEVVMGAEKSPDTGAVPDPCTLITYDEAASVFGAVEEGAEFTFAIPGIRKCDWDAADGSYSVGVQVLHGGLEAARDMVMGQATDLTDLGAPGFIEMMENGWLVQVAVDAGDYAVQMIPVSMDPHGPDSDVATKLKELAVKAADRL